MIRFPDNVTQLFGRKLNILEECFSFFLAGNTNFGLSASLTYHGNSKPLFGLVKYRGSPVTSSYISLQVPEITALINVLGDFELRTSKLPTEPIMVVTDLTRPLTVELKAWPGKPWLLLVITQIRKGRKYTFETPMFNHDKV